MNGIISWQKLNNSTLDKDMFKDYHQSSMKLKNKKILIKIKLFVNVGWVEQQKTWLKEIDLSELFCFVASLMMLQSDGAQLARVPQWHQNTNYYNFAVSLQLPALGWSLIYLMDSFRVLFDYYDFEILNK